jgi:hypothetical protein
VQIWNPATHQLGQVEGIKQKQNKEKSPWFFLKESTIGLILLKIY